MASGSESSVNNAGDSPTSASDPDRTIDVSEGSAQSEISDHSKKAHVEVSEISDMPRRSNRRRLGSNGPVLTMNPSKKPRVASSKGSSSKKEKTERKNGTEDKKFVKTLETRGNEDEFEDLSVVKMGCNKCMKIFYSDGAYNQHLFEQHRIKNTSRHPPTIINKLWTRIPSRGPLQEGQRECNICKARFFNEYNLYKHKRTCTMRTIEKQEEKQCELYKFMEREAKEREDDDNMVDPESANGNSEVVEPTQNKRQRRSRSKKRKWTATKKRYRKPSSNDDIPSRVYVRTEVNKEQLNNSRDKKDNVKFYQEVLNKYKNKTPEVDTTKSTIPSTDSRHETDTDFKITTTPNTSTESSLPSIHGQQQDINCVNSRRRHFGNNKRRMEQVVKTHKKGTMCKITILKTFKKNTKLMSHHSLQLRKIQRINQKFLMQGKTNPKLLREQMVWRILRAIINPPLLKEKMPPLKKILKTRRRKRRKASRNQHLHAKEDNQKFLT